jgi:hypothetical protein
MDDEAEAAAAQVRDITARLTEAGDSRERDPPILVIADAGVAHAARLLARRPASGSTRSVRHIRGR